MRFGRPRLPILQSIDKTALEEDSTVRAKSQWTPGGRLLWLIAAVLASLVVCARSRPAAEPPDLTEEVEIELVE